MDLLPVTRRRSGDHRCDNLRCRTHVRGDPRGPLLNDHLCGTCRAVLAEEQRVQARKLSPELRSALRRIRHDADRAVTAFLAALELSDRRRHAEGAVRPMTPAEASQPPRAILLHDQVAVRYNTIPEPDPQEHQP